MNGKQLEALAIAAFGARWKSALESAVGISREQIWRYATDRVQMSDDVQERMRAVLLKQIKRNRDKLDIILMRNGE